MSGYALINIDEFKWDIKLIKNNIKSSSSYGKYFAKAVSQGEVTLDEIAAEACRNSGFCEGIKAVWQTGFKP